jgi:hypothetical protein
MVAVTIVVLLMLATVIGTIIWALRRRKAERTAVDETPQTPQLPQSLIMPSDEQLLRLADSLLAALGGQGLLRQDERCDDVALVGQWLQEELSEDERTSGSTTVAVKLREAYYVMRRSMQTFGPEMGADLYEETESWVETYERERLTTF